MSAIFREVEEDDDESSISPGAYGDGFMRMSTEWCERSDIPTYNAFRTMPLNNAHEARLPWHSLAKVVRDLVSETSQENRLNRSLYIAFLVILTLFLLLHRVEANSANIHQMVQTLEECFVLDEMPTEYGKNYLLTWMEVDNEEEFYRWMEGVLLNSLWPQGRSIFRRNSFNLTVEDPGGGGGVPTATNTTQGTAVNSTSHNTTSANDNTPPKVGNNTTNNSSSSPSGTSAITHQAPSSLLNTAPSSPSAPSSAPSPAIPQTANRPASSSSPTFVAQGQPPTIKPPQPQAPTRVTNTPLVGQPQQQQGTTTQQQQQGPSPSSVPVNGIDGIVNKANSNNRTEPTEGVYVESQRHDTLLWWNNVPLAFLLVRSSRVKGQTCSQTTAYEMLPDDLVELLSLDTCYPEYTPALLDGSSYGPNRTWSSRASITADGLTAPFIEAGKLIGDVHTYKPDAREIILQWGIDEPRLLISDRIQLMQDYNFIDPKTRHVSLELLTFTPNLDAFAYLQLFIEILPSGRFVPRHHIKPFHVYSQNKAEDIIAMLLEILLVIYLCYAFVYYIFVGIYRNQKVHGTLLMYFTFWKVFRIINIVGFITVYYSRFHLWALAFQYDKTFFERRKMEIDARDGVANHYMFNRLVGYAQKYYEGWEWYAVNVILAWVLLFSYFQSSPWLSLLSQALRRAMAHLIAIGLFFGFVIMGWGFAGNIFYGYQLTEWRTFMRSTLTLMRMTFADYDYEGMRYVDKVFTPFFFVTFMIMGWAVLVNTITSVLAESFLAIRGQTSKKLDLLTYTQRLVEKTVYKGFGRWLNDRPVPLVVQDLDYAEKDMTKRIRSLDFIASIIVLDNTISQYLLSNDSPVAMTLDEMTTELDLDEIAADTLYHCFRLCLLRVYGKKYSRFDEMDFWMKHNQSKAKKSFLHLLFARKFPLRKRECNKQNANNKSSHLYRTTAYANMDMYLKKTNQPHTRHGIVIPKKKTRANSDDPNATTTTTNERMGLLVTSPRHGNTPDVFINMSSNSKNSNSSKRREASPRSSLSSSIGIGGPVGGGGLTPILLDTFPPLDSPRTFPILPDEELPPEVLVHEASGDVSQQHWGGGRRTGSDSTAQDALRVHGHYHQQPSSPGRPESEAGGAGLSVATAAATSSGTNSCDHKSNNNSPSSGHGNITVGVGVGVGVGSTTPTGASTPPAMDHPLMQEYNVANLSCEERIDMLVKGPQQHRRTRSTSNTSQHAHTHPPTTAPIVVVTPTKNGVVNNIFNSSNSHGWREVGGAHSSHQEQQQGHPHNPHKLSESKFMKQQQQSLIMPSDADDEMGDTTTTTTTTTTTSSESRSSSSSGTSTTTSDNTTTSQSSQHQTTPITNTGGDTCSRNPNSSRYWSFDIDDVRTSNGANYHVVDGGEKGLAVLQSDIQDVQSIQWVDVNAQ